MGSEMDDQAILMKWNYELDLFKNRHILYLLLRAFGITTGTICVMLFVMLWGSEVMTDHLPVFLLCTIGGSILILGITCLIYFLVAKAKKGNNTYRYEMTSLQIRRILTEDQVRRDIAMGRANSILGIFGTGPNAINSTRIGIQLETGSYRYIEFDKVHKVKLLPEYDLILLKDADKSFEVYASRIDYEKVKNQILIRVPNAGI